MCVRPHVHFYFRLFDHLFIRLFRGRKGWIPWTAVHQSIKYYLSILSVLHITCILDYSPPNNTSKMFLANLPLVNDLSENSRDINLFSGFLYSFPYINHFLTISHFRLYTDRRTYITFIISLITMKYLSLHTYCQ